MEKLVPEVGLGLMGVGVWREVKEAQDHATEADFLPRGQKLQWAMPRECVQFCSKNRLMAVSGQPPPGFCCPPRLAPGLRVLLRLSMPLGALCSCLLSLCSSQPLGGLCLSICLFLLFLDPGVGGVMGAQSGAWQNQLL